MAAPVELVQVRRVRLGDGGPIEPAGEAIVVLHRKFQWQADQVFRHPFEVDPNEGGCRQSVHALFDIKADVWREIITRVIADSRWSTFPIAVIEVGRLPARQAVSRRWYQDSRLAGWGDGGLVVDVRD